MRDNIGYYRGMPLIGTRIGYYTNIRTIEFNTNGYKHYSYTLYTIHSHVKP